MSAPHHCCGRSFAHECEVTTHWLTSIADKKDHSGEYGYGLAVEHCYEAEDGTLWVGNGEYGSPANFCPFCGYEAETKILVERRTA